MSRSHERWLEDLRAAPLRAVTQTEFRELALSAGWQAGVIDVYLKAPVYVGYVLVGRQALRIGD